MRHKVIPLFSAIVLFHFAFYFSGCVGCSDETITVIHKITGVEHWLDTINEQTEYDSLLFYIGFQSEQLSSTSNRTNSIVYASVWPGCEIVHLYTYDNPLDSFSVHSDKALNDRIGQELDPGICSRQPI